ncbi:epoxide hydrolase family protein [Enterovirga aerilata]|uniref:epoxide hydrolase family protein n=1 Tax=Enterovirga aerilata TaxID=2730920 RepID=UPI001AEE642B
MSGVVAMTPYALHVADEAIADLRERLARTRFPDQAPGQSWAYGTDVDWLKDLVAYWRERFDWREAEARINAFPNYTMPLGGIDLHFMHVPGKGPDPKPLLLSHGWPGSVVEFLDIIPRLTDPAAFGRDPADAFTVVAPSLPGYGLSFAPGQRRFSVTEIADLFAELMSALGYDRFMAQGGDWGSFVTAYLGYARPDRMIGIHLNMLPVRRDPEMVKNPTPDEARFLEELKHWLKEETGYQWIQGTRPQTLAFALTDSPAGLAAWIGEKFCAWSDNDGDVWSALSRDAVLTNLSLYWFTGAIGSSFWPYYARMHSPWPIPEGGTVDIPTGYAAFPREIVRPPRSLAEKTFRNIQRWTVMERGGHFAALEQPEALARDIVAFARTLRA